MVPAAYHSFFAGCASVAGTLVGLLFVAISVSPEKLASDSGTAEHRIRAAAAFSALSNSLVISLFALLPTTNLGDVALLVAIVGLSSTAGLVGIQLREPGGRRAGSVILTVFLFAVYGVQLANAIRLIDDPRSTGALYAEAVLVIVCFVIGIARAWELLGAQRIGLIGALTRLTSRRPPGE